MSRGQTLRALVNERLTAAAEDIFVLFERTIAEYEEELCRCKEENQSKQQLLDQYSRRELVRENVQIPSSSPGPGLKQEITETPRIKEEPEEQSVKLEEEQLPVPVPESSAVCVKTEDSSLLQQIQIEHREETQGEDISSEPHFHSETEGHTEHSSDTDNDQWETFCWSAAQMETEADGDHGNQVQIRDKSTKLSPQNASPPETTVHSEHMPGADGGAERKNYQCFVCNKSFGTKNTLQVHIRLHTGERPYSCAFCQKTFSDQSSYSRHKRTHTGEKPYSCPICKKPFSQKCHVDTHMRTHTGQRTFDCTVCKKSYAYKSTLQKHIEKKHRRNLSSYQHNL